MLRAAPFTDAIRPLVSNTSPRPLIIRTICTRRKERKTSKNQHIQQWSSRQEGGLQLHETFRKKNTVNAETGSSWKGLTKARGAKTKEEGGKSEVHETPAISSVSFLFPFLFVLSSTTDPVKSIKLKIPFLKGLGFENNP